MTHTRFAFVKANWHADIVGKALKGFIEIIPTQQVDVFDVPGAFELPLVARDFAERLGIHTPETSALALPRCSVAGWNRCRLSYFIPRASPTQRFLVHLAKARDSRTASKPRGWTHRYEARSSSPQLRRSYSPSLSLQIAPLARDAPALTIAVQSGLIVFDNIIGGCQWD